MSAKNTRNCSPHLAIEIFITFFRIGAFTFGGGLAMLPLFEKEVVENKNWLKQEDVPDIYAISQSLPGIISVNASVFIGYRRAGFIGALAAVSGMTMPSLLVILVIAGSIIDLRSNPIVLKALIGVRAAVTALIGIAAYKMSVTLLKDPTAMILLAIALSVILFTDVIIIHLILAGGIIGLTIQYFCEVRYSKKGKNSNYELKGEDE